MGRDNVGIVVYGNDRLIKEGDTVKTAGAIVSIVEPEILIDGDHSTQVSQVSDLVSAGVYKALPDHNINHRLVEYNTNEFIN